MNRLLIYSMIGLSVLCYAPLVEAGELSITILQKGTGDPVEGATVVLKGNAVYEQTDRQGIVLFPSVSAQSETALDMVKVLGQGYQTLEETITAGRTQLTLYITPNLAEMEGLEVVEKRKVEKVSKVVISKKELLAAPGTQGDPIKILQSLPGVVSAGGSGTGQVYMRGSEAQETLYWVDQLPVGYLYHWGGLNSVINPALVSDFNVFLGGFPVEYGDFLGGAVDVKLRAPKEDRIHTNLHLGTYESSFLVEGPLGDSGKDSFYLAARRSYIDLIFSPAELSKLAGGDSKNTIVQVPTFYDAQALYRHETDAGYIDLQYFSAGDQLEVALNDAAIRDPEVAGALRVDISSQTYGVNWKEQWTPDISSHLTTGYNRTSQYFQIGSDPYGTPYFTDIVSNSYFAHPSVDWQVSSRGLTTIGLDSGYLDLPLELYIAAPTGNAPPTQGGFTSQPKYKVKRELIAGHHAPYLKYQHQWSERWKTAIGLRYTYSWGDQGGNAPIYRQEGFSPRLSGEFQLSDSTTILASWGDYYQMPQGFQLLADFGNPRLSFTRAEHRILGVEQKLNELWSLKVEGYHKPMRDLVVSIEGASPPDNYLNQGKGLAYGFDLFLKRKYENRTMGWLSYSYAHSERTDLNSGVTSSFAGDQPHTFTAVWGQPFTDDQGQDSDWDWGIKLQAHSGQPYTPVVGRVQEAGTGRWLPVYGGYNSKRLPLYAKLDVRFSKEVLYDTWKMKYVFDIQNVTFRQNVSGYKYADDYSDYNSPTVVSRDLFLPFFGIEAEF